MTSLKKQTVTGVLWSGLERFSGLLIQLVTTIVIARVVSPADFGLWGMLTIFFAFGQVIASSGFGQALIRKSDANDLDFSSVFYLNLFIGGILYLLFFLLSPEIANFFNQPELEIIAKVAFLVIPINAFGIIQLTIFHKDINFRPLSKITIAAALISGIVGITFAYRYQNVWALVYQYLTYNGCRTIFLWFGSAWRPILKFSINSLKTMFSFSVNLLFSELIGSVFNNIYSVVIGKFYAPVELGYFTQAERFQNVPTTSITGVIQSVTFPVLAKRQNQNDYLKENYLKIIGVAFFVVSPVMMYLMTVSENLFELLLGPKWHTASIYFKYLCIVGALYPLSVINLNILKVKGNGKLILKLQLIRKTLLAVILMITFQYGMMIVIYGWVLYSICELILNVYFSGKQISLTLKKQFFDLIPIFISNVIAIAVTMPLNFLNIGLPILILMLIQLVVFTGTYLIVSYYLKNRFLNAIFEIVNELYTSYKINK